jgi:catechol 2,3-dioxygenase-like lactoylglutathione lyase family enzyme
MNGNDPLTRTARVALVLVSLSTVGGSESGSQTRATSQPIRQIDHIMIRTGDPRELYAFFAETLHLPTAWPMTSPRAGVMTGGIGFGNVNVEAIQVPGQTDPRPRLVGFAFEPSALDESLIELNRRGLTSGERRPLVTTGPDGSERTLWTNVTLRQFSDSDNPADATIHIFLSEYSPTYVNVDERRTHLRSKLVNSGGGPLGVVDVKEVIIGAVDLEVARRLWQKLLDPMPSTTANTWQIGSGPAVRLVPANENRIQALLIRVASLERAKAFLRDRQLLGADAAGQVTIAPSKLGGLDLRLVDR